ncbi:MAG: DeoR/GlpR transcriptional regulator [Anaerolineae bacterium]|nr:DeoR/GlpR transcriptional regulator [Anaerolineae bacterium]
MMNAHERQKIILQLIADRGAVTVADLCERFRVSDMTIRRDLSTLENASLLRRIHGGAVSMRGRSYEPPFLARVQESRAAKQAIGAYAATLVHEGNSIALDLGTTTLEMARHLTHLRDITVLTNCLPIANLLTDHPDIRLILAGGIVRHGELSIIGAIAEYTFSRFYIDKAFIGIGGVDMEAGLTEYNLEDAEVKCRMIQNSQRRILLTDSSKFGRKTFASVGPLSAVDEIVTDDGLPEAYRAALERAGITLHIVPVPESD